MRRPQTIRPPLFVALATAAAAIAACSPRAARVETDPAPPAVPTVADYYGTYDLYLANTPPDQPLTAAWSPTGFVVSQVPGGPAVIEADVAIDPAGPETGSMRIWAEGDPNPLCAAEGLYEYSDDGTELTLRLVTDPCANRAASADGSRLVRRAVDPADE